jgi:hypothetical protein
MTYRTQRGASAGNKNTWQQCFDLSQMGYGLKHLGKVDDMAHVFPAQYCQTNKVLELSETPRHRAATTQNGAYT